MLTVKIQKLHENATAPSYAHPGDAGMDLFAAERVELPPGKPMAVSTGIAMEIPVGYVGLIWDKSGLAVKNGLKTLGGVVDAGYRGEVLVGLINLTDKPYIVEKGHKAAQILIQKIEHPNVEVVTVLSDTSRGKGGFGSTGK